ncbi:hypothetical protein P20495_0942 [Pseudoalteromonas sp. BSi20495]|nr:hypothetical protein P20495_0942 [Pseudoalteromonas sp. BSi20495]
MSKKTEEKKLPIDLIHLLIDKKISLLKREIDEILLKNENLKQFKIDLVKEFT